MIEFCLLISPQIKQKLDVSKSRIVIYKLAAKYNIRSTVFEINRLHNVLVTFRAVLVNDIKNLELTAEDEHDASMWSSKLKSAGILTEEVKPILPLILKYQGHEKIISKCIITGKVIINVIL